MTICIISFSGRENGNCGSIAKELEKLYINDVKIYDFSAITVTPCMSCCYECFGSGENCPYFNDSIFEIYDTVTKSDLTYFIVPNYCDYPCSLFFVFNERSQCYFQKREDRLDKYLAAKKKFIVVSNTNRDNFTAAFKYHVEENTQPDILFLEARKFKKVSIKGDLTESEEARKIISLFADVELELLTENNIDEVRKIQRDDISTDFVDDADTIMELTQYGTDNDCIGDTYAVKYRSEYI